MFDHHSGVVRRPGPKGHIGAAVRPPALADERPRLPTDKGASAGATLISLFAGTTAEADNTDEMALLRPGATASA